MSNITEYPVFEADQVLKAEHLNNMFNYLDEQNRLTHTCLIGIGIVCGLDTWHAADTITISAGCGVTSRGYLMRFDGGNYTNARAYSLPSTILPEIKTLYGNFSMWQLFTPGADNLVVAGDETLANASFLQDKVVVLFLEMDIIDLKNCTTNDCNDKGSRAEFTIRPLLFLQKDLAGFKYAGFEYAKANLPDIILKRYNVPFQLLYTPNEVLGAFYAITDTAALSGVADAYIKSYDAFKLLLPAEPANPFLTLNTILNNQLTDTKTNKYIFTEYYYDYIDDLVKTYNEFRTKGNNLLVECCPDENNFPYHLALGEALSDSRAGILTYRNYFIHSPVFGEQKMQAAEIRNLFARMKLLVANFQLPDVKNAASAPIRITPSRYGDVYLSKRAIPYYYNVPFLLNAWNYAKTCMGKASRNLSYYANTYTVDDTVINPLKYELEPYNFFRIEGHIGKTYITALTSILSCKQKLSLAFDVLAIKTGIIGEKDKQPFHFDCYFNDLEISYDIARREYESAIGQTIEWLDDNRQEAETLVNSGNNHVLENYIDDYLQEVKKYMVDSLPQFIPSYDQFMSVYEGTEAKSKDIRAIVLSRSEKDSSFAEDLIDHLDDVIHTSKKGAFRALFQEYTRRNDQVNLNIIFSNYTAKHTGIDHKAGVPKSGTFILVYNEAPVRVYEPSRKDTVEIAAHAELVNSATTTISGLPATTVGLTTVAEVPGVISTLPLTNESSCIQTTTNNFTAETAQFFQINRNLLSETEFTAAMAAIDKISVLATNPKTGFVIEDGIVYADFYLPYICCSDCTPISYILQEVGDDGNKPVITISPNSICSNQNILVPITVTPPGGVFSSPAVKQQQDGSFAINSVDLPVGKTSISYTIDSTSVSADINVFAAPDALFTAEKLASAAGLVQFKSVSVDTSLSHDWNFGDPASTDNTSNLKDTTHKYPVSNTDRTFIITHTVKSKDGCSDLKEMPFVIKGAQQEINETRISCFAKEIPLEDSAAVSNAGVLNMPDLQSLFDAHKIKISDKLVLVFDTELNEVITFTIRYKLDNGTSVVIKNVTVTILGVNASFNLRDDILKKQFVFTSLAVQPETVSWHIVLHNGNATQGADFDGSGKEFRIPVDVIGGREFMQITLVVTEAASGIQCNDTNTQNLPITQVRTIMQMLNGQDFAE